MLFRGTAGITIRLATTARLRTHGSHAAGIEPPLLCADGSVAVQIRPEVCLETLDQLVQRCLGVGQVAFEILHALFKGCRAGSLLRNLALLYQVPE
jgi:hypothetical protein